MKPNIFACTLFAVSLGLGLSPATGTSAEIKNSHGLSAFGDLKYKPGFTHFDYVNPEAPKGGRLRLHGIDSFDSLNGFILKGVPAQGIGLVHASLMERAMDEPDAMYGFIAETVSVADDRKSMTFSLRPGARFNDGKPVRPEDVVFTFNALITKGHPSYRVILAGVAGVQKLSDREVRFTFEEPANRDLVLQVASLPVLSEKYFESVPFDQTSLKPPVGAGPYQVSKVEPGRFVQYGRIKDYWAKDLPVLKGRYNFDAVRFDYFRDRDISFEAFFSGAYDFREEFTSRNWATQYNRPPVQDGRIKKETLPDNRPSGMQAFFFNLRRDKFKDRRVRAALDLAFDFEWTNRTLFYGLYGRTNSMFQNTELAADAPPSPAELALLEPLRGQVPEEVFHTPYQSPKSDGSGRNRKNLRAAAKLLREAGWHIKDNRQRVNAKGEALKVEFLLFESSFQRIINPYVRNLKRIGIAASIRIVDVANFQNRTQNYDFDVIVQRYVQPNTPGIEQKTYFSSEMADIPGSRNLAGIKDPAVDSLIESIINARSRPDLIAATRALDRVLMWNRYTVPQWFKGAHNIAYWDKFSRPKVKPRFALGVIDTWWHKAPSPDQ